MPAKYATQPHWRQRRQAIGRKMGLEAEMLFDSEPLPAKSKPDMPPHSPVTVAANLFDLPEIKPIVLPGTWIEVGKGGKPLRSEQKMYNEPKKKPRKRNRRPKEEQEEQQVAPSMSAYEELPSSSKCLAKLAQTMLKHEQAVTRKHEAKHWAKYRQDRALKSLARDELVAVLAANDSLADDDDGAGSLATSRARPIPKKWLHDPRKRSHAERTRRTSRFAAAAARCYFEPDDESPAAFTKTIKDTPPLPSTSPAKVVAGVPQLAALAEAADRGRPPTRADPEPERAKMAKRMHGEPKEGRSATGKNCTVM